MKRALSIAGLFMAAFLLAQDRCEVSSTTSCVISSGRGWYAKDKSGRSRLLLRDQKVAAGELLYNREGAGDLILECRRKDEWLSYHCDRGSCNNVRPCTDTGDGNLKVRSAKLAHLTEMFAPLVRREQAELAGAAVRGEGGPSDGVIAQTPEGVHWAPALIRVLEGRYCFRLTHLPAGSAAAQRTFMLDWDRTVEKEGIAPVPNLAPGLYAFEKGTRDANAACRVDANSTPAWVLVVPQARFDEINKQWDEDSSKVDELEQFGSATSVVTTLRHAVLAWLAESVEGK